MWRIESRLLFNHGYDALPSAAAPFLRAGEGSRPAAFSAFRLFFLRPCSARCGLRGSSFGALRPACRFLCRDGRLRVSPFGAGAGVSFAAGAGVSRHRAWFLDPRAAPPARRALDRPPNHVRVVLAAEPRAADQQPADEHQLEEAAAAALAPSIRRLLGFGNLHRRQLLAGAATQVALGVARNRQRRDPAAATRARATSACARRPPPRRPTATSAPRRQSRLLESLASRTARRPARRARPSPSPRGWRSSATSSSGSRAARPAAPARPASA